MKVWIGKTKDELLQHYGYPSKINTDGKNGLVLIYIDTLVSGTPGQSYTGPDGYLHVVAQKSNPHISVKIFCLDSEGIIYSSKWQ